MFNYSYIRNSSNAKVGSIPVTRTDKRSCPDSCPLKGNGCYAENFTSNLHWSKLDTSGLSLDQLCNNIKKLPVNTLWRHNEAGDLPGYNDKIDETQLNKIIEANKKKRGFTYTHYPLTEENIAIIKESNKKGFTINASLNSLDEVKKYSKVKIPKVVILPEDAPNKQLVGKETVIVCPNQLKDSITCDRCGLCQVKNRKFIIGFKVHGVRKNAVLKAVQNI